MPRILPPLETFRFFEAAARHLNFTHAAEEMHVTHGAVSQRIKRLEEDLGTPLFRRSGRGMLLTDEGRRLLERVRAAIGEITEGVEAIRSSNRDRILTVSMVPGFATYWLLPRLAEFIERHPDIEVNIRPTLSLTDFTRDEVDMAVRFGPGRAHPATSSKCRFFTMSGSPGPSGSKRSASTTATPVKDRGTATRRCCLRPPLRAWVSPWRVHRSSQPTWNPAGWFDFFPGACPRDTRTSSCIRSAPRAPEKSKCSRSGCSSRSDLSSERTPSSLKPGRTHCLCPRRWAWILRQKRCSRHDAIPGMSIDTKPYGSIFFTGSPPAQPSGRSPTIEGRRERVLR